MLVIFFDTALLGMLIAVLCRKNNILMPAYYDTCTFMYINFTEACTARVLNEQ